MQASIPCQAHQGQQATQVCVDKSCKQSKIFCKQCSMKHHNHKIITFQKFRLEYQQFRQLFEFGKAKIKSFFDRTKDAFNLCIKRAEDRIYKQFMPLFNFPLLPNLNQIQSQQLQGLALQLCTDDKFCSYAVTYDFKQQQEKNQKFFLQNLQIYIDQMNSNIMSSINKMMSQLVFVVSTRIKPQTPSKLQANKPEKGDFQFSDKLKPSQFQIQDFGRGIRRTGQSGDGYSMYAICNQPLSKTNSSISFTIVQQNKRFIYFGVCDPLTFSKFNFKGPLYQLGNKMYGIRQNYKEGLSAISLHNSIKQYSNSEVVTWDIQKGDIVTIQFNQQKNSIIFINNSKLYFEMPLDKQTKQFYPFVGLKFKNDYVKIVSQNAQIKKQNKSQILPQKKGFLSFFSS